MGFEDKVDRYERDVRSGTGSKIAGVGLLMYGVGIIIMCILALLFLSGCLYVIWTM